jgi:ribonuclease J
MKALIHRGSNEIGGTCIQLSTEKTTILLDLGLPLSNGSKTIDVASLKPDAVLISHPHQDHFGLIDLLAPDIPVYIGELGKRLIDATRVLLGKDLHSNDFHYFKSWQSIELGDFTITPYLVDHSAVDAYGFLIEAEGKRVFYSGDFRAHGRKSKLFDKMITHPPKDIDLLFMEGTMMQRSNDEFPTESDVEKKIYETIKGQENISFLISSSQNIDRIVSAYRACLRARKTLVIDIYTAWVLEQLKLVSNSIPTMDWELVKVYTSYSHDNKLKEHPEFFGDFRKRVYRYRVTKENLQSTPTDYLFLGKMSHFKIIDLYRGEKPVNVIYSQWLGYLSSSNDDYYGAEAMAAYRTDPQINFVYAHTSGHATVEDLKSFARALKPKMLVPVHTEHGGEYMDLFSNVTTFNDGCNFKLQGGTMTFVQLNQQVKAQRGKSGGWPADFMYEAIEEADVVRINITDNGTKQGMWKRIDPWGFAFLNKVIELTDKPIKLKFTVRTPTTKADTLQYEAMKRRLSYLSIANNLNILLESNDLIDKLYTMDQLLNRPENEIVRAEYGKRGHDDTAGRLEKDFQTYLFGKGKESDSDIERTNERLALFGKDFVRIGKIKSGEEQTPYNVEREFPTGVFSGEVKESNRLLPTEFVDLVTFNRDGNLAIIELKFDDPKLEVISQVLNYALFFMSYRRKLTPLLDVRLKRKTENAKLVTYLVSNTFHNNFKKVWSYYSSGDLQLKQVVMGYMPDDII